MRDLFAVKTASDSGGLHDSLSITSDSVAGINLSQFSGLINNSLILNIFKWLGVFVLGIYCLFGLIIIKQVRIMADTFDADVNWLIVLVAWIHFLLSIGLTIFVILVV